MVGLLSSKKIIIWHWQRKTAHCWITDHFWSCNLFNLSYNKSQFCNKSKYFITTCYLEPHTTWYEIVGGKVENDNLCLSGSSHGQLSNYQTERNKIAGNNSCHIMQNIKHDITKWSLNLKLYKYHENKQFLESAKAWPESIKPIFNPRPSNYPRLVSTHFPWHFLPPHCHWVSMCWTI